MARTKKQPESKVLASDNKSTGSKKLTKNALNAMFKEQNKMKEITVQGEYKIKVQPIFTEPKIDTIVHDFLNLFEQSLMENDNKVTPQLVRSLQPLLHTLIMREFTDLTLIPEGHDLHKMTEVAMAIYSVGKNNEHNKSLLEEIMEAFDNHQLNRVYIALAKSGDRVGKQMGKYVIEQAGVKNGDYFNDEEIEKLKEIGQASLDKLNGSEGNGQIQ